MTLINKKKTIKVTVPVYSLSDRLKHFNKELRSLMDMVQIVKGRKKILQIKVLYTYLYNIFSDDAEVFNTFKSEYSPERKSLIDTTIKKIHDWKKSIEKDSKWEEYADSINLQDTFDDYLELVFNLLAND